MLKKCRHTSEKKSRLSFVVTGKVTPKGSLQESCHENLQTHSFLLITVKDKKKGVYRPHKIPSSVSKREVRIRIIRKDLKVIMFTRC